VTHSIPPPPLSTPHPDAKGGIEFFTEAEMQRRERENLAVVLERARWKIKGADGASELLGVKPTTLLSRMKKMGLKKPAPPSS
jgi:transcriptional regulator with GAF, ATPase, and Fis domain